MQHGSAFGLTVQPYHAQTSSAPTPLSPIAPDCTLSVFCLGHYAFSAIVLAVLLLTYSTVSYP